MKIDLPKGMEVVTKHHTCDFHKKHPGKNYAGCTCSGAYIYREKKSKDKDHDGRVS